MRLPNPSKTQRVAALLLAGGLAAGSVCAYVVLLRWRLDAAEKRAASIQATLAETHNTHSNNINEKMDKIATMGKTKAELEARIQALELEVEKYRKNTMELNIEIVQSRELIEALKTEIEGLGGREGAADYQQQIHDLNARVEELTAVNDEQTANLEGYQARFGRFKEEMKQTLAQAQARHKKKESEFTATLEARDAVIAKLRGEKNVIGTTKTINEDTATI
jgi:chromosome segregation ATPase